MNNEIDKLETGGAVSGLVDNLVRGGCSIKKEDKAYALFALGRFIDYRIGEGMAEKNLYPFMQSYLNISAETEGLECQELHTLRSREVLESPESLAAQSQLGPTWLPLAEKLRLYRREQGKNHGNSDLEIR